MHLPFTRIKIARNSIHRALAILMATSVYVGMPVAAPQVFAPVAQAATADQLTCTGTGGGLMWIYGSSYNAARTNCIIATRFDSGGGFNTLGTGFITAPATGSITWRVYIDDNCQVPYSYYKISDSTTSYSMQLPGTCYWGYTNPITMNMVAGQRYAVEVFENSTTGGGIAEAEYKIGTGNWTALSASSMAPGGGGVTTNVNGATTGTTSSIRITTTPGDVALPASSGYARTG